MTIGETLDLRRLPVWERAGIVFEHADLLTNGTSVEFLTEIDPRALLSRLEQLRPGGFVVEHRHIGEGVWRVVLTRVAVEPGASLLGVAFARSPVLSKLNDEARSLLRDSMTLQTARKGQHIGVENVECQELAILIEGALAVFVGAGTRERSLFHLFPFDIFNQAEFFDGGMSIGRTTVLTKVARYASVPYDVAREAGRRDPEFLQMLSANVSQNVRTLARALAVQVSAPILSRVASALLPYAAPERGFHPALPPLPTMTQAQVAASAGTVKEVAARAIAELERLQALRRERGHIRYLDRSKLLETIEQS